MVAAVLAEDNIKDELNSKKISDSVEFVWADSMRSLLIIDADVYFDLNYEFDTARNSQLKRLLPRPVFINSVIHTSKQVNRSFIRINAWPGMLNRDVVEISYSPDSDAGEQVKEIFDTMNWNYAVVPDTPGMITPRIVSMIINEAWYALEENVSTRSEIDTAMKLGTNYPYGPFEWGDKIGLEKIRSLLRVLGETEARYIVAPLLNRQ
jgi:3-hydroxybutyryl-CoA dehydrogenase